MAAPIDQMQQLNRQQQDNAPIDEDDSLQVVTIIGAGIAGLSAAHELVERGFIVQVIEPRESQFDEHECEVGGLAASQYSRTPTIHTCHPELFDRLDLDVPDWHAWDQPPLADGSIDRWSKLPPRERAGNRTLLRAIRANTMRLTQRKLPFVERIVFKSECSEIDPKKKDDAKSDNEAKLNTVCIKILQALWLYYGDLVIGAFNARFNEEFKQTFPKESLDGEVLIREVFLLEVRGNCGMGGDTALNNRAWERACAVRAAVLKTLKQQIKDAPWSTPDERAAARQKIDGQRYYSHQDLADAVIACWDVLEQLGYTGDRAADIDKHLVVRVVQTRTRPPTIEAEVNAFHYVDFRCVEHVLPGEHGYRYFPSFYNNLFDTMQRTPVIDEDGHSTFETVYDRLIHPPTVSLATNNAGLVRSPKQLPPSFEEGLSRMKTILEDLRVTSKDLQLATNRLLKMATSCQARRKKYEDMSWLSFVKGDDEFNPPHPQTTADAGPEPYSKTGEHVLRTLPQSLIAMSAEECDARTYGIAAIQNVRDYQAEQLTHTDRMLNGPTSEVWLRHWKRYLKSQNVRFFVGHVEKLVFRNGELVPIIVGPTDHRPKSELPYSKFIGADETKDDLDPTDYYVLAIPLEAAATLVARGNVMDEGKEGLTDDLRQLRKFAEHTNLIQGLQYPRCGRPEPRFDNPMRDFVGIQFYFSTYVQIGGSYVYYPSSDWKLTSIAQVFLWHTRPSLNVGYIGGLSVDIGDMYTPYRSTGRPLIEPRSVWQCTRAEMAWNTWAQIKSTFKAAKVPAPNYFHIDSGLQYGDERRGIISNRTPFMIALPRQFEMRPGSPDKEHDAGADTTFSYPTANPHDTYMGIKYAVSNNKWVLCASYMKSYTRINTMEAAVEIGRHAANTIIKRASTPPDVDTAKSSSAGRRGERTLRLGTPTPFGNLCDIYNVERDENPNFESLKRLDSELMAENLPHFLDILRTFQLIKLAPDVEFRPNADGVFGALGPNFEDLANTLQNAIQRKLDVTNAFFDWMEKGRGQ